MECELDLNFVEVYFRRGSFRVPELPAIWPIRPTYTERREQLEAAAADLHSPSTPDPERGPRGLKPIVAPLPLDRLPQIPEMFLEHLWISQDERFFPARGL